MKREHMFIIAGVVVVLLIMRKAGTSPGIGTMRDDGNASFGANQNGRASTAYDPENRQARGPAAAS